MDSGCPGARPLSSASVDRGLMVAFIASEICAAAATFPGLQFSRAYLNGILDGTYWGPALASDVGEVRRY
jgi:hypothetical protein